MAQPQEEDDVLTSYFPNPPPFYKHFTPKNLDALSHFKDQHNLSENATLTPTQLLDLPTELRYLVPPAPPVPSTEYTVFGKKTKLDRLDDYPEVMSQIRSRLQHHPAAPSEPILDWSYEQLYPSSSTLSFAARQQYLFRFLRSMVLSYIEVLGIVAQDPTSEAKEEKLGDLLTLVLNMHALINEYRPHQARETLIREMERQVERKRGEVEGVRRMGERVREVLRGIGKGVVEAEAEAEAEEKGKEGGEVESGGEERRLERQREMWGVMDEVLG